MRYLPALALLVLSLATLSVAESVADVDDLDPAEAVRQFQRDQHLIELLIDNGLELAHSDNDPLKRAQVCNRLVERFSQEMKAATRGDDRARAIELGGCLTALLKRGVALNLMLAYEAKDPPAAVKKLGDQAASATKQIEAELGKIPPSDDKAMSQTLEKIQQGRSEVEDAMTGKGKGKGKGKAMKEKKGKK